MFKRLTFAGVFRCAVAQQRGERGDARADREPLSKGNTALVDGEDEEEEGRPHGGGGGDGVGGGGGRREVKKEQRSRGARDIPEQESGLENTNAIAFLKSPI